MGVEHSPSGQARRLALPPEPVSARIAREFVRVACWDWGLDEEMCEDAALVATELVANVVDHARTSGVLSVGQDGTGLRIEVEDFFLGPLPAPLPVDPTALRGRGLQVVAGVSAAWGVREGPGGKSVWAVVGSG